MTTTTDAIEADAKTVIDLDGEAITYTQDGVANAINAIPLSGPSEQEDTAGNRVTVHRLVLAVAKADIAAVKEGDDVVTVPAKWLATTGTTATGRVAKRLDDQADPGMHLVLIRRTTTT